jgi:hypothetical protein
MSDPLNSVFYASMNFNFFPVLPIAALVLMYLQFRSVSNPLDNQLKLLFTPAYKGTVGSFRRKLPAMLTQVGGQPPAVHCFRICGIRIKKIILAEDSGVMEEQPVAQLEDDHTFMYLHICIFCAI